MNTLTDRLNRLSERGPHADAGLVIARATAIAAGTHLARQQDVPRPNRSALLAVAAVAVVLVAGLVITMGVIGSQGGTDREIATGDDGPASDEAVEPVGTLPDSADLTDVPVTVAGEGPSDWYRLQSDLDVSWYSPSSGTPMLCFRTPNVPASCKPDTFAPTEYGGGPIGVATAGDQLLVVTLDPGDTITLATTTGDEIVAPVTHDPGIGWGVARITKEQADQLAGLEATYPAADATTVVHTPAPSVG